MRRETTVRLITVLLLLPVAAAAQVTDLRLPISLDADSTAYDGKNSMLMFRGLRMTQGTIGIEAEEGRASNLNFEESVWQFSGNVIIDVENGHIECDSADLKFTDHQLTLAKVAGLPAIVASVSWWIRPMPKPASCATTCSPARSSSREMR